MAGQPTWRVATWNLWWRHGDWAARHGPILASLERIGADVVALQEVSTREPDHLEAIAVALGYEVVCSPDGDADRHGMVNAIASRHPIIDHEWTYLDVGEMRPHRTVLRATVDVAGERVDVYCTHLSHGFHQSALRTRQLSEIAAMIAERRTDGGYPPVLMGDLNALPESDEIRSLTGLAPPPVDGLVFSDAWAQVGAGDGATYAASNPHVIDSAWPNRRLDYVLVGWPRPRPCGNPAAAQLFGDEPLDGVVASDHYGVAVDLVAPGAERSMRT